jgi:hypothetical protein
MSQVVSFRGEVYIVTREEGRIKKVETIYNGQIYPCDFAEKDMEEFCNVANNPTKRMPKTSLV